MADPEAEARALADNCDHQLDRSCEGICVRCVAAALHAARQAERERTKRLLEAWDRSWDCSHDPGHREMNTAISLYYVEQDDAAPRPAAPPADAAGTCASKDDIYEATGTVYRHAARPPLADAATVERVLKQAHGAWKDLPPEPSPPADAATVERVARAADTLATIIEKSMLGRDAQDSAREARAALAALRQREEA